MCIKGQISKKPRATLSRLVVGCPALLIRETRVRFLPGVLLLHSFNIYFFETPS